MLSKRKLFQSLPTTLVPYVLSFGPCRPSKRNDDQQYLPFSAERDVSENVASEEAFRMSHFGTKGKKQTPHRLKLTNRMQEAYFYNVQDCDQRIYELFTKSRMKLLCKIQKKSDLSKIYESGLPEVVFCGRSNVGKSSLVNRLFGRNVMPSGDLPGKTQELTFYRLGELLSIGDFPGYGFAFAEKSTAMDWISSIEEYIKHRDRNTLKMIYLLIDSRHGLKPDDIKFLELLHDCNAPFTIVFTKSDYVYSDDLARQLYRSSYELFKRLEDKSNYKNPEDISYKFLICSTKSKSGIGKVRNHVGQFVASIQLENKKIKSFLKPCNEL